MYLLVPVMEGGGAEELPEGPEAEDGQYVFEDDELKVEDDAG